MHKFWAHNILSEILIRQINIIPVSSTILVQKAKHEIVSTNYVAS